MSLYAVTREGGVALYAQIAQRLEQDIQRLYGPGDCLPAESELALRFGVNRHTLRRAVDELVDAGLLERRHGRGVFVLDTQFDYPIGMGTRFTENLHAQGLHAETRVLRQQRLPASVRVAERLGLACGEPVFWLETLRTAQERPLCLISHFVCAQRFPGLPEQYQGGSFHQHLQQAHGLSLRRSQSLVSALLPQGDDAAWLAMPHNRPVLRVKSLNVDAHSGAPIEYAIARFRADRLELRITP
jgi:GntR family phosphonate transport system transcriptional regulator